MFTTIIGIVSVARAEVPIELPINRIAQLDYAGIEYWNDNNTPPGTFPIVNAGDSFSGVLLIENITDEKGKANFSAQLEDKELVIHFQFSVVAGPDDENHLEFNLLGGDFFRFYVRDLDILEPLILDTVMYSEAELVAFVTQGEMWLTIEDNVPFFESVNNPDPNPIPGTTGTLNRAWSDVSTNETGYSLLSLPIRTILSQNSMHNLDGDSHRDHLSSATFDNRVNLPPGFDTHSSRLFFNIFGEFRLRAIQSDIN